jgi:uncharacterized membrane protein YphA (DoxX/SURF4 family)
VRLIRSVARPLIAGIFIYGGWDAAQNPESKLASADKLVPQLTDQVGVDVETMQLVKLNGAVQVGAGVAMALGWKPRLAALALAGSTVPTTLAGHRFWEIDDPKLKKTQTIHFLKNAAMLGGLLMVVASP